MIFLDAFLRFSGIGLLLLIMVLIIKNLASSKSSMYLFFSAFTVTALFIGFSPEFYQLPGTIKAIFRFADIPHLIFIWLFALSLFQRNFIFNRYHLLTAVVYSFPIVIVRLGQFGITEEAQGIWYIVSSVFSILLMMHLILITTGGKKDDLNEKRRKRRDYFVFVIVIIALGTSLSEIYLVSNYLTLLYTVKIAFIWLGVVWTSLWLLKVDQPSLNYKSDSLYNNAKPTSLEISLLSKLDLELVQRQAYVNPKLSIDELALKIGISTTKLRHLINKILGFENFSSYVNSHRMEAIKKILRDPTNRDIPILTITLNNGFNSISPFNKAFKNIENMTPTQYRNSHNEENDEVI